MDDRQIIEEEKHVSKAKRILRLERRREKLRKKLTNEKDIKYLGPLSYRYLRILAWIFFVMGQVMFIALITEKITKFNFLGQTGSNVFNYLSRIATPLFIIASFGIVLNHRRSVFRLLLVYGAAFLGIGIGITLFYYRYVRSLFVALGAPVELIDLFSPLLGNEIEINVFADLFCFLLFHFFVTYTPRVLENKRIWWFRLLAIIPVLYILVSYILKIIGSMYILPLPFFIFPFLTTKSPLVFLIFASISLWIKNREKLFLSLGSTREEYHKFLLTRRNSLSFSIKLSTLIALFSLIDLIAYLLFLAAGAMGGIPSDETIAFAQILGIGQCAPLLAAIPFILLYSYTKNHKNTLIDLFIPVGGIALTVLVYIESVYQLITNLANA